MANQAQVPFITDLEEQEPQLSDDCSSGDRNTDRLRRNRESAKRCRLRRKEYIQGVETKCKTLEEQNESLVNENAQLKALVDQLLAKNGSSPDCLEFDASPCKRIKIEEGVTSADLTNESAATRSLQQETVTYPLATVTTFLFLVASTLAQSALLTHLTTAVLTQTTTPAPHQLHPTRSDAQTCYNQNPSGLTTCKSPMLSTHCWSNHHLPVRWQGTAIS